MAWVNSENAKSEANGTMGKNLGGGGVTHP